MCGIAGLVFFADRDSSANQRLVVAMSAAQAGRGPDGAGSWSDRRVALGAVRLAVTGASPQGDQPIQCGDHQIGVMNGEIYAFDDGGGTLAPPPPGRSDSPAALDLIARHGPQALHRLIGPFAIAIYDPRRGRLLLARDLVGKKPLYIARRRDRFAFGSTIAAVRAAIGATTVREEAVYEYLVFRSVGADRTSMNEIDQLPAGGWMTIDLDGSVRTGRWGSLPEACDLEADAADVRREVDAAISRRIPDRGTATLFLSGGLDSAIAAFGASRAMSGSRLGALSIGYDVDGLEDETSHAERLAAHLGLPWQRLTMSADEVPALLADAACLTEDPIQDPVTLPTVKLARAAAAAGRVALTGDGSDEIWGGYERFAALPATLDEYYRRTMVFTPQDVGLERPPQSYWPAYSPSAELPLFDQVLRAEVANRMKNYHLARVDKIAMGVGLEPRSPFLDPVLLRFGLRIPAAVKCAGGRPKACLIDAYPELPAWLRDRPKQPFSVPIHAWLQGPLRDFASDALTSPNAEVSALVDCRKLLARLRDGAGAELHGLAHRAWSLLQLQIWFRTFACQPHADHALA